MEALALYIHIPFCEAKCAYCDFTSYAGFSAPERSRYTQAIAREMEQADSASVNTVYIGGGTPTLLSLSDLGRILEIAGTVFQVASDAEITVEANPGTVNAAFLSGLRSLGVTRLSLGVQSLDDVELKMLGRIHTPAMAIEAFHAARGAGIQNISLDLIYGLPGQSDLVWSGTLSQALDLEPEHLSLYALSVEDATPLADAIERQEIPAPDPDRAASMYETAQDALGAAGFQHYEISNWSRTSGLQCSHNMIYWRNESYQGIGAGAHSWQRGRRKANVAHPSDYASRIFSGLSPAATKEPISLQLEMGETTILGLRLVKEGVPFKRFLDRFGVDVREVYGAQIAELQHVGLLEVLPERMRLTSRGYLLGNQAFFHFLPDAPQN